MATLFSKSFNYELARQLHRSITNTLNFPKGSLNNITLLDDVLYTIEATEERQSYYDGFTYTSGRLEVFVDGQKLSNDDFYDSTGNSVTITNEDILDEIEVGSLVTFVKLEIYTQENPSDFYYIGLGKTDAWVDDEAPPTPQDTRLEESSAKRNIIAVKRVQPTDVAFLVERVDWQSGNTYQPYRHNIEFFNRNLYDPFYSINNFRIYKCLDAPRDEDGNILPSTTPPVQTTPGPFILEDGYMWQFIYEIPVADRFKFMTEDYAPVRFYGTSTNFDHNGTITNIIVESGGSGYTTPPTAIILGDGYGATAEVFTNGNNVTSVNVTNGGYGYTYAVVEFIGGGGSGATAEAVLRSTDLPVTVNQDAAAYAISTKGRINTIDVVSPGQFYSNSATSIRIEGDGVGALAEPVIENGEFKRIEITNSGLGYTYADVIIEIAPQGTGVGAVLEATIEPEGGHGSNVPKELYCTTIGFDININACSCQEVLRDFFVNNDFRQISLLKNLKDYNETTLFSNNTATACYIAEVPEPQNFDIDDVVESTISGGTFIVISKIDNLIYLLPVVDLIIPSDTLRNISKDNIISSFSNLQIPEVSVKTGELLYLNNTSPVFRQQGQIEQIKLMIHFDNL